MFQCEQFNARRQEPARHRCSGREIRAVRKAQVEHIAGDFRLREFFQLGVQCQRRLADHVSHADVTDIGLNHFDPRQYLVRARVRFNDRHAVRFRLVRRQQFRASAQHLQDAGHGRVVEFLRVERFPVHVVLLERGNDFRRRVRADCRAPRDQQNQTAD